MAIWPIYEEPDPIVISTCSRRALGTKLMAGASPAPTSVAVGAAAYVSFPFEIYERFVVQKLFWLNGAVVSGNVEVAVYSDTWQKKLVTTGSVAAAGANTLQEGAPASPVTLGRGRYYAILGLSSATQAFFDFSFSSAEVGTGHGLNAGTTGITIPLAEPLSTPNVHTGQPPFYGLSQRTLVV